MISDWLTNFKTIYYISVKVGINSKLEKDDNIFILGFCLRSV